MVPKAIIGDYGYTNGGSNIVQVWGDGLVNRNAEPSHPNDILLSGHLNSMAISTPACWPKTL